MTIDLIAAAQAAHATHLADQAREQAEEEATREIDRQGTIEIASAHALEVLGTTAETLNWRHHPEGETTDHLSAAIAALPPGRIHDGRLVYLHQALANTQTLALIRTCRACGDELVNDVDSLAELGALLNEGQPDAEDADGQEPGPLTAIEIMDNDAARAGRLARRLIAEYPAAGLSVRYVSLYGNESGGHGSEIQLTAEGVDGVRRVAAALGAEVKLRRSDVRYGTALEHADASATYDGIKVDLTGYRVLPDDEAAAWLAEQNQAAEDSDGGDV